VRLTHRLAAILTSRREQAGAGPADGVAAAPEAATAPATLPLASPPVAPPGAGPLAAAPAAIPPAPGPGAASAIDEADPCGPARAAVADACSLAERMAALSVAGQERLRAARRAYDEHAFRRESAAAISDPRAVRAAKDEAQATFRRARLAATDRASLEAAAREWLREVDRINARTREAVRLLAREDAAEAELLLAVDRLGIEADGARIAAESAAEACRNARITLATCEERERVGARPIAAAALAPAAMEARTTTVPPPDAAAGSVPAAAEPPAVPGAVPADADAEPVGERAAAESATDGEPAILPLLAGDRAVLRRLAAELGEGDRVAAAGWEIHLAALVEAVRSRAIDSAALTFPEDHPFWGPHTQQQCREITAALAALGYRYDGVSGFADGRIPGQRELSLALGYAGLDPMRVRIWPTEAELPHLFEEVTVDAGRFVAEAAGELMLGDMIDLLGRRAEDLSEIWNAWGRIRPLLLAPA
jgi:hypothetical protein